MVGRIMVIMLRSKALRHAARWRRVRIELGDRTRHLGPVWRSPYQTALPAPTVSHLRASEYSLSSTDNNLSA